MNLTTLEVIKLAYHREPSSDGQGIDCGLGMNEEDLVRDSLELRRLGGLLRGKGPELTSAEMEELKRLESTVRDALQEMEDILQPKATSMKIASVLNEPDTLQTATSKRHDSKPAFKRTFFYSSESPYPQMRDKSGTFRIAPPAPTRHQARSKGRVNASKSHVNLSLIHI